MKNCKHNVYVLSKKKHDKKGRECAMCKTVQYYLSNNIKIK